MENQNTDADLIRELVGRCRVLTLGGVAVISHGLSRNTYDADIWIDPLDSVESWADKVSSILFEGHFGYPVAIGSWDPITRDQLAETIENDGVLRVSGLNRPVDIFRRPNELPMEEFDAVWQRATLLDDGTRLPDAIDLLMTKQDTQRDKDVQDILFLEAKAEREYLARLPGTSAPEATAMLERFLTPKVAELALEHPASEVRELATRFLLELAAEGNPFARDIAAAKNLG